MFSKNNACVVYRFVIAAPIFNKSLFLQTVLICNNQGLPHSVTTAAPINDNQKSPN